MATNAGRDELGRGGQDSGRSADDPGQESARAFSDEGMRRIVHAQDRDRRGGMFSEDNAELEAALQGRRRLVPIGIAIAALVCFGAVVWYAYSWGTGKMASDQLPMVSADVSPEKSRPDQPGGLEVPHQDKLVLNNGEPADAAPVVERLLPPPEIPQPPEPLPEAAAPQIAKAPPVPEAPTAAPAVQEGTAAAGEETEPEIPAIPDNGLAAAPAEPEAGDADLPATVDAETGIALPQMKPLPSQAEANDAAADSSQPEAQSEDQIAALLAAPPQETANGNPAPSTGNLAAGDVVLQLSSVKSEAAAASEWARLQAAHPGLLGDLPLALDTAEVNGTTYYRVQTGPFPSRSAAADICGQLKTRNQDCLVKQR